MPMKRPSGLFLLLASLALAGCDGIQSMTGGDGLHGRAFNHLFILFMVVTGFMYLLVIGFLFAAVTRRKGRRRDGPKTRGAEPDRQERRVSRAFAIWVGLIVVGLTGLTVAGYVVENSSAHAAEGRKGLEIEITANQWWWDITYKDADPSLRIHTANELHLPVGTPAHITLHSNDVIHSFWVPNLAGKQDLIPGRTEDILLLPIKTGFYRGQCAEFCGKQHAHMAIDVIVEPRAQFHAWQAAQLATAPPPSTPLQLAGYDYVTTRECSLCHTIAGTPAQGTVGPDLTHIASRHSIAAGTFPMTRGHLYGWIADPQHAKPGAKMPYIGLTPDELHAVVAYLETLK